MCDPDKRRLCATAISNTLAALAGLSTVWAATRVVTANGTSPFPTIQAAINASTAGDTVLVQAGYYEENLVLEGMNLVLMSESGPTATTIDGRLQEASCLQIRESGPGTVIDGFTITGGRGSFQPGDTTPNGGGILCLDSAPMIRNCILDGNSAVSPDGRRGEGGGIWIVSLLGRPVDAVVESNRFQGNRAGLLGGALCVAGPISLTIQNNEFFDNVCIAGDGGAFFALLGFQASSITHNVMSRNTAGDHGGAIYITSLGSVEIGWNVIAENVAQGKERTGDSGGGIWISHIPDLAIRNNTLVYNSGMGGNRWGGALVLRNSSGFTIDSNIIAYSLSGGGVSCIGASGIFSNNLVWANNPDDGSGTCGKWWCSEANLVADPHFCNGPGGDYSLHGNSIGIRRKMGASIEPGCEDLPDTIATTWSSIKALFHCK